MKPARWEGIFYAIVGGAIFLSIFFLFFSIAFFVTLAAAIASLPYFMDARYQYMIALRTYELECGIVAALRSAKMLTGQDWMNLQQITKVAGHKLGKKCLQGECIIVLNMLITKDVVAAGEASSGIVYRLIDAAYLPHMPEKIQVERGKSNQSLAT
jgi:hypothetical protein